MVWWLFILWGLFGYWEFAGCIWEVRGWRFDWAEVASHCYFVVR